MNEPDIDDRPYGQIVLVFQGGGALGAYQAGVYEALEAAGIRPDWVIGTSIGAINAGLIAGNPPEKRLDALRRFWSQVQHRPWMESLGQIPFAGPSFTSFATIAGGLEGFFRPNLAAFLSSHAQLGPDHAGYYSTAPLAETLSGLIDLKYLNSGAPRLTVGAAHVNSGDMRYFDSRESTIGLPHILASGALPPAFPAVRIEDEYYWDGGILSNTPVEAIFDDNPRRNALVFSVHIWNPHGREPGTMWEVMSRQKDIQYASRTLAHIERQRQLHRLRHVITELAAHLPADTKNDARVRMLKAYGCVTRMHVVRLVAPAAAGEDHMKDIDFGQSGIKFRWDAGRADMERALASQPWTGEFDPLEGFILHEIPQVEVRGA